MTIIRARDAIVAIFGAPVRFEDHAAKAVQCAIEMQKRIRQINDSRRAEGKVYFEMRLGLNSGPVLVGAIGCDLKLEYTSIGETTNLANRMEANCRIGHIMISENTYNGINGQTFDDARISDQPEEEIVKGYEKPVLAYGVLVHDLEISKNIGAIGPLEYYNYETISFS